MKFTPSVMYNTVIPNLQTRLHSAIETGLENGTGKCSVFFRADDIGVPSHMFSEMIVLFKRYQTPLCLAAVPTWLTQPRLDKLREVTGSSKLFCWHQHGWMHKNHELSGKKQEFGESRIQHQLEYDIERGKERLRNLLGDDFYFVFTPPWNRCGQTTIDILKKLQFKAISRNSGATPLVTNDFTDYQINVDLHTRKEQDPEVSFEKLYEEIQFSFSSGISGIMLHHQRMNANALLLLEIFLKTIAEFKTVNVEHFENLRIK